MLPGATGSQVDARGKMVRQRMITMDPSRVAMNMAAVVSGQGHPSGIGRRGWAWCWSGPRAGWASYGLCQCSEWAVGHQLS